MARFSLPKPLFLALATVFAVQLVGAARAQERAGQQEPLVEQVRIAIRDGVKFLRETEDGKGHWEMDQLRHIMHGGQTSLAMLALLNSGVAANDPMMERGLKYLRDISPKDTYVVGLQTMVFAAAGKDVDRERIQRNVDWLVQARTKGANQNLRGWSYQKGSVGQGDNSNTQYALLGLHEGHQAGAKIERAVWESIREYYLQSQGQEGGWSYSPDRNGGATLTMTTAGLCGLYIAGLELNEGREVIKKDGTADNCGIYKENAQLLKAHEWVGKSFNISKQHAMFYNLYGIERTGRLSGQRFLGDHDWYREGCELLVAPGRQNKLEGSWGGNQLHDQWPVVSTSFALLFLSKGRTPILISKMVHGPGEDWNNDRNDARNLVDFASKELFKKQPLAWQIFDAKRANLENRGKLMETVGDLLLSPIVYFNGHQAPRFLDGEIALLHEYADQGGFILAEACCGDKRFDAGVRDLVKKIFGDNAQLRQLDAGHPIWSAYFPVAPNQFELWGVEQGCKTVFIYSPQDLSCGWESNKRNDGESLLKFRLGANIIAYATGMELPKPRLTKLEVIDTKEETKTAPRGFLKAAQIRHEGDWQPAPRAMRNLMSYLRDKPRLDVALHTEPIRLGQESLQDFKFLYMHGRNAFDFGDREIENLRADLQTGGLLLADACCGKKAFDGAFRSFSKKLFPDLKLEPILLDDRLFSKELNGEMIQRVRVRQEKVGGGPEAEFRDAPPFLEGIKYKNRWVVIYSKYDLGCALEKHQSTDCLGHDYPSAIKLGAAAVFYAVDR